MTEQNMKGILKSLSPNGRKVLLNNFEESLKLRKFKPRSLTTRTTARSYLKYLGSKRFNDKIVQRAQYIDKVDFGRAPIEFIYRKLVKY
jgi:Fic family protein